MYHNNLNNLETFMKLSEKDQLFLTDFIDVWQQFDKVATSYFIKAFVTVRLKAKKKSFRY